MHCTPCSMPRAEVQHSEALAAQWARPDDLHWGGRHGTLARKANSGVPHPQHSDQAPPCSASRAACAGPACRSGAGPAQAAARPGSVPRWRTPWPQGPRSRLPPKLLGSCWPAPAAWSAPPGPPGCWRPPGSLAQAARAAGRAEVWPAGRLRVTRVLTRSHAGTAAVCRHKSLVQRAQRAGEGRRLGQQTMAFCSGVRWPWKLSRRACTAGASNDHASHLLHHLWTSRPPSAAAPACPPVPAAWPCVRPGLQTAPLRAGLPAACRQTTISGAPGPAWWLSTCWGAAAVQGRQTATLSCQLGPDANTCRSEAGRLTSRTGQGTHCGGVEGPPVLDSRFRRPSRSRKASALDSSRPSSPAGCRTG